MVQDDELLYVLRKMEEGRSVMLLGKEASKGKRRTVLVKAVFDFHSG